MTKHGAIDRIEEGIAVIEFDDDSRAEVAASELWEGAKEGDRLVCEDGGYAFDPEDTAARREKLKRMTDSLWA
jgi:hypothetical protein